MQEQRNADSRATPWEIYFFEEGGWELINAFESENDALAALAVLLERSEVPEDYFALIGPDDKVMPLAPARRQP